MSFSRSAEALAVGGARCRSRLGGRAVFSGLSAAFVALLLEPSADALTWKGHEWNVTSGGMAGVAQGSPSNVSVDGDGYLHLKITKSGSTWTAAELFTTDRIGFGTYQWQIDGPIDVFDKNVVLGLFPYGPSAGIGVDGTNEIDIEYSFWGNAGGVNGDFTDYPASGKTVGELSYEFSLGGGTFSTSRFIWNETSIQDFLMSGFVPVGSTAGLIKSFTYAPPDPATNIPQQALPLGMNLWCFQAPPSNGQNVEVVIRDFQYVPEGASGSGGTPGTGGGQSSGGSSGAGTGGAAHAGGTTSAGGAVNAGGTTGAAGAVNAGGTTGVAGATNAGGTSSGTAGATGVVVGAGGSGQIGSSGAPASGGQGGAASPPGADSSGGCGCKVRRTSEPGARFWVPFAMAWLVTVRRRRRRSAK